MINVCLSTDNNYAPYAGVVIASILSNAGENDKLNFYILDGNISQENKEKIQSLKSIRNCNITFVSVDESKFEDYKSLTTHKYISLVTYYRLRLSEILTEVDRIIYLDCDTIVNCSLSDLFNTELNENYMAGVIDIRVKYKPKWKNKIYVNAGMLLMDLEKIRRDNIEEKFLLYAKKHFGEIKTGDQDIINFVLGEKIKILDDLWNVQVSSFLSRSNFTKKPKIIHYVARKKPWIFGSFAFFKDRYFKYQRLTPWEYPKSEKFKWTIINEIYSILNFIKEKPLFIFRPKFWEAVFYQFVR